MSRKRVKVLKRSFADAAAAAACFGEAVMEQDGGEDWLHEEIVVDPDDEVDKLDVYNGVPVVCIPQSIRKDLVETWKSALILRCLGKKLGFVLLQQRLARLWNVGGRFELIDLEDNWYVVRFERPKDCLHVLVDGPWKIFDNYVVPQRWRPDFVPAESKLEKMAVWVRLPGLPVEYFREDVLKLILQKVGTPLKLDRSTAGRTGSFCPGGGGNRSHETFGVEGLVEAPYAEHCIRRIACYLFQMWAGWSSLLAVYAVCLCGCFIL